MAHKGPLLYVSGGLTVSMQECRSVHAVQCSKMINWTLCRATGTEVPYVQALRCAKVWSQLDLDGDGNSLISPGIFLKTQVCVF